MARDPQVAEPSPPALAWAEKRCPRCGAAFRCGAGTPSCWCDDLALTEPQRARLAELRLDGCLCRSCLEAL